MKLNKTEEFKTAIEITIETQKIVFRTNCRNCGRELESEFLNKLCGKCTDYLNKKFNNK